MRLHGGIPNCYEEPPFSDFWTVNFIADSDVTKFKDIIKSPAYWIFSIADLKIKQNDEINARD